MKSTIIERVQSENVAFTQFPARSIKDARAMNIRRILNQKTILLSGGLPGRSAFFSLAGDDTRANRSQLLSLWETSCQQIRVPGLVFGVRSSGRSRFGVWRPAQCSFLSARVPGRISIVAGRRERIKGAYDVGREPRRLSPWQHRGGT